MDHLQEFQSIVRALDYSLEVRELELSPLAEMADFGPARKIAERNLVRAMVGVRERIARRGTTGQEE